MEISEEELIDKMVALHDPNGKQKESQMINKNGNDYKLPTEKTVPEENLKKYLIMIYGRPGVGKTTLASQFEDPFFISTEPGAKSLALYKEDVTNWRMFKDIVQALKRESRFQTVVIDTLAIAYDMCLRQVSRDNDVEHPSELAYGKGWVAVDTEFNKQLHELSATGRGVILLSHSDDKDVEQFDGTFKSMTAPDLSKQAMRFIDRSVDLLAYYFYSRKGQRKIRIQATDEIVAKNRIKGHFQGVSVFNAGNSEEEAYKNLVDSFHNRLQKEETEIKPKSKFSLTIKK